MKKEISAVGGRTAGTMKAFMQKLSAAAMISMSGMSTMASATAASSIMKQIVEIIVDIFPLFGGVFILLGVFSLFMAIKTDQPEKRNTAIMDIAIGSAMIVFRTFIWDRLSGLF